MCQSFMLCTSELNPTDKKAVDAVFRKHFRTTKRGGRLKPEEVVRSGDLCFTKRPGTAAVGQYYETKLLTMVLFRALIDDRIVSFCLGNNLDEAGAFDDVVLRYRVRTGEPDRLVCLQAKHRDDKKRVEFKDLIDEKVTKGDLHMLKYFLRLLLSQEQHEALVENFFSVLRLYTEQATEQELDEVIRNDLKGHYREDVFLKAHESVQSWWKRSGQVPFQTEECKFFERAAKEIELEKWSSNCVDRIKGFGVNTADSEQFLWKFWKYKLQLSDANEHRCRLFRAKLFELFRNDYDINRFMCVPLQVKMVATVFLDQVKPFCMAESDQVTFNQQLPKEMNLVKLYDRFVEITFKEVLEEEKNKIDLTIPDNRRKINIWMGECLEKHKKAGIYATFNESDRTVHQERGGSH
ncbi:hypothetical protein quinque_013100 [Culex quinquefasciatus]